MLIGKSFQLYIKVKIFLLKEQLFIFKNCYKNWKFILTDLFLFVSRFFINPFRSCRKFLEKKGEDDVHQYGETPVLVLLKIIKLADIKKSDKFLELGSGRGRSCFFLSEKVRCHVVGIEIVPTLYSLSYILKKFFGFERIDFYKEDMMISHLDGFNVIYLYGTGLSRPLIKSLTCKFSSLKKNTKIITISYPLTYYDSDHFILEKDVDVEFAWGKTKAYLNLLK
jgi:hypothetical protein